MAMFLVFAQRDHAARPIVLTQVKLYRRLHEFMRRERSAKKMPRL